jgi:hypothetical protein
MNGLDTYLDLPDQPKIALMVKGDPTKRLKALVDGLIAAFKADASWYDRAMIRADLPKTRVTVVRYNPHFSASAELTVLGDPDPAVVVATFRKQMEGK